MNVRLVGLLCVPTISFAASVCPALLAAAQEFRIETEVYVGDATEPASRTITLFEESAVYEFIDSPPQVIIYHEGNDDHGAQFILLDPASKRRTDVDVKRIERLMGKLTKWAAEQDNELLKFAADPK